LTNKEGYAIFNSAGKAMRKLGTRRAGQPPKNKRNQELIRIRDQTGVTFAKLGKMFGISKQASWAIYNRDRNVDERA